LQWEVQKKNKKIQTFFLTLLGRSDLLRWLWCTQGKTFSSHRWQGDHLQEGLFSCCHGNWSTSWPHDLTRHTILQSSQEQPDMVLKERRQRCEILTAVTFLCLQTRSKTIYRADSMGCTQVGLTVRLTWTLRVHFSDSVLLLG
jgi:hypothetical protein